MRGSGPAARRRRRITPWRTAALVAALILAAGTYALGRYVIAPKPPQEVRVVITTQPLPEGKKLVPGDFRVVTVRRSSAPADAVGPVAAARLKGQVTKHLIPAGTFLRRGMLSAAGQMPDQTHALVGLALKPGQMPAGGLAVGQHVDVVLLPTSAQGLTSEPIPVPEATIWELLPPDSSGAAEVTVLVPRGKAPLLTNYAARGQVSLLITSAVSG
jgi:hypothetical protein